MQQVGEKKESKMLRKTDATVYRKCVRQRHHNISYFLFLGGKLSVVFSKIKSIPPDKILVCNGNEILDSNAEAGGTSSMLHVEMCPTWTLKKTF